MSDIIISADSLCKSYLLSRGVFKKSHRLHALQNVSFDLRRGECLTVVGESGCGKSTLARLLSMIERPSSGRLEIDSIDVASADSGELRYLRRLVQIVFQNPYGSLNPRRKIGSALMEVVTLNDRSASFDDKRRRAYDMLERVGLRAEHFGRYPHMFSGGQRQRIAIARALMAEPQILILDEPVSALDVSIQGQILNLLVDLQAEYGLTYVFISHSLPVVRYIGDVIMVKYLGKVMEVSRVEDFFVKPAHPYSQALISATPKVEHAGQKLPSKKLQGELPSPIAPPSGCVFHPRCPMQMDICRAKIPSLWSIGEAHTSACWLNSPEAGT